MDGYHCDHAEEEGPSPRCDCPEPTPTATAPAPGFEAPGVEDFQLPPVFGPVTKPVLELVLAAVIIAAFFLVAALLLRAYVADILITALPYGALATPIGALLFCFFFGMAVLLGAELNATIQARWPAPLRRHQRRRRERRAAKLEAEARKLGLR